jgi:hypothetical protein
LGTHAYPARRAAPVSRDTMPLTMSFIGP